MTGRIEMHIPTSQYEFISVNFDFDGMEQYKEMVELAIHESNKYRDCNNNRNTPAEIKEAAYFQNKPGTVVEV